MAKTPFQATARGVLIRLLPVVLAGLFLARPCAAYVLEGSSWPDGTITMQLQIDVPVSSLYDGRASFNDSAADALKIWNTYIQRCQFAASYPGSTSTVAEDNGLNNVFADTNAYGESLSRETLAITLISYEGSRTLETDVIVNKSNQLNSYDGPLIYSGRNLIVDVHRVLLHEFGHVLGLDHPDEAGQTVSAIMNSTVSDLDSLTSDDIAGAKSLYDKPAPAVNTVQVVSLKGPASHSISQYGPGTLKLRIRRSAASNTAQALTVNYTLSGDAVEGTNYRLTPAKATIPAGRTQVKLKLRPIPGSITDGRAKVVFFSIESSSGGYETTGQTNLGLTIDP